MYIYKFSIIHPEQIRNILSQSYASINLEGRWKASDCRIQICLIPDFLTFGQISAFQRLFQITVK